MIQESVKKSNAIERSNNGIQICRSADLTGVHRWVTIVEKVLYTKEQLERPLMAGIRSSNV
jgi:hypothetical protein